MIKSSLITVMLIMQFSLHAHEIGRLPVEISNNAVALVESKNGAQIYSFNGLTKQKDWLAVSNLAMGFDLTTATNFKIDSVPYANGRLASIAVTVKNKIYLFGGYTVSETHEELSTPEVYQFDPITKSFSYFTKMPISVDDTVALVYKNRYIYLISGWHNNNNISDVQVLDIETKQWSRATPYPGKAVFGHSAGIVGNQMVVADGVKVAAIIKGKRQYKMSSESYIGKIDLQDITKIQWKKLPQHPGKAKYRMAAVGLDKLNKVVFAGGSSNAYNYNGIGYNGVASQPSDQIFAWDFDLNLWQEHSPMSVPSMDHRGLIAIDDKLYIVGGMTQEQKVTDVINSFTLD